MVTVDDPVPLMEEGEKVQVAAVGKPEQDSVTLPVNPPIAVSATVDVAELPGATTRGDGTDAAITKSGAGAAAMLSRLISAPPKPNTRSGRPSSLKSPPSRLV